MTPSPYTASSAGIAFDHAPDYALHVRRAHEMLMRLSAKTRFTAATALFAMGCIAAVPWHADDAASTRLALLFNNNNASAAMAVANNPSSLPAALAAAATASVTVAAAPDAAPAPSAPTVQEKTLALSSGQTLSGLLKSASIVTDEAEEIASELRTVFDIRRLKAGQKFTMVFKDDGEKKSLVSMNFSDGPTKEIKVERQDDGSYDANAATIASSMKRMATHGKIEDSLYQSATDAGLPVNAMRGMMKMFAHAIDFQRDIKPGDTFDVMYDQRVTAKGDALGDAQIVYASIETGGKTIRMYRYEYEKGQYDFFNETGQTAKRGLLRTPIDGAHITSTFGQRMHPVLGYSKMHEGVDFGAPAGTPIYAAGDGVIARMGWFGGYGRYVELHHSGSIDTAYAHTSAFAKGLGIGSKVKQGQVIAYVGSTGRSTGPHLHYEVHVSGNKVNPMSVNIPTGRSLSRTEMVAFGRWKDQIKSEFKLASDGVNPLPTNVASAK